MIENAHVDETGALVMNRFFFSRDRYHYDCGQCSYREGWRQYDTSQDASYFGIWVHLERRVTVTWCEGDEYVTYCPTEEVMRAQLAKMAKFHGEPPPAFVVYSYDDPKPGVVTRTEVYDERPSV